MRRKFGDFIIICAVCATVMILLGCCKTVTEVQPGIYRVQKGWKSYITDNKHIKP